MDFFGLIQNAGNFKIASALQIKHKHSGFKAAELFHHLVLKKAFIFLPNQEHLRIEQGTTLQKIHIGLLGFLLINGLIQRNIGIERRMFFPVRRLNCLV